MTTNTISDAERKANEDRKEKMLSKVNALLAKASRTDFPEEARSLQEAAEKLMLKYAIDASMIDANSAEYTSTPTIMNVTITPPYATEFATLLNSIASVFSSFVVSSFDENRERYYRIIGFQSDIDVVWTLFDSISMQMNSEMYATTTGKGVGVRKTFLAYYTSTVTGRLKDFYQEATDQTPGSALVLASRADQVSVYIEEKFPDLKSAPKRKIYYNEGADLGTNGGNNADIGLNSRKVSEDIGTLSIGS